jgi:hypothetical protein
VRTGAAPTLRNVIESSPVISTYCNTCLTAGRQLEPCELAERLGWEATKEDIEARLRCIRCGARRQHPSRHAKLPFTAGWSERALACCRLT